MIISKIMSGVYELWKYGKSLYTSDHTNHNDYEYLRPEDYKYFDHCFDQWRCDHTQECIWFGQTGMWAFIRLSS